MCGLSRGVAAALAWGPSHPPMSPQNSSAPLAEDMDPEVSPATRGASPRCSVAPESDLVSPLQLARYLNRNYWEKKQEEARKSPTPSAPAPLAEPAAQPGEGHAAPASGAEVRAPRAAARAPGSGTRAGPVPLTPWSLPDASPGGRLSAHGGLQRPLQRGRWWLPPQRRLSCGRAGRTRGDSGGGPLTACPTRPESEPVLRCPGSVGHWSTMLGPWRGGRPLVTTVGAPCPRVRAMPLGLRSPVGDRAEVPLAVSPGGSGWRCPAGSVPGRLCCWCE